MQRKPLRKLVLALLAVLLWLGFLVDGSYALFSDQVSLTGNSVVSGTTNLLISNSQNPTSTIFEKTREGFDLDLSPGESADRYFLLKNTGSANVTFKLSFGTSVPTGGPNTISAATDLRIVEVDSEGVPVGSDVAFNVWAYNNSFMETQMLVPKGVAKRYRLTTSLSSSFNQQGEALNYDLIVKGLQVLGG